MDVAYGHRQPVTAGLAHKTPRFCEVGKAQTRGKELLVGREGASLVTQDRAQLGLAGDARLVGELDHLLCSPDVLLQVQAGAVDHDRLEP